MGCFFIGKQKIVLFSKYRKNIWESVASAFRGFKKSDLSMLDFLF